MRADAQRNRSRILDAARSLVASTGADATMEDIARHAGVAVGTLYRHFPAKGDLVAAVVDDSTARIARLAESAVAAVEAGAAPGRELEELFRAVVDRHATDRAFKAAASTLDHPAADLTAALPGSATARAMDAITDLLGRACAAGSVRADLTLADLVVLLGTVPGPEVDDVQRDRWVDIVLAGLRPAHGT